MVYIPSLSIFILDYLRLFAVPIQKASSRHVSTSSKHHHRQSSAHQSAANQVAHNQMSGNTARETFLNYFFGQGGPGPVAGSSMSMSQSSTAHHHNQVIPIGRDVYGSTPASGLLAGKRGMDGQDAAYDMKSLGKHIEAVSCHQFCAILVSLIDFDEIGRSHPRLTAPPS